MAENRQRQASLDDLGARIAAARDAQRPARRHAPEAMRGWEVAFRLVLELMVGIAIGSGIGFGLDTLLGTLPLFLAVFGLMGFAAGVRVMLRSAAEYQARSGPPAPAGEAPGAEDDHSPDDPGANGEGDARGQRR